MNKRDETKLENLQKKIQTLKAREHKIIAEQKQKERKERTRRLIQHGAIIEKYLGQLTPQQVEYLVFEIKQKSFNHRKEE